jgi:hypothetical protein
MATSKWQQADDYYWTGPSGWTICRVFVDGVWRYELWRAADPVAAGSRPSLDAAQMLYESLVAATSASA